MLILAAYIPTLTHRELRGFVKEHLILDQQQVVQELHMRNVIK